MFHVERFFYCVCSLYLWLCTFLWYNRTNSSKWKTLLFLLMSKGWALKCNKKISRGNRSKTTTGTKAWNCHASQTQTITNTYTANWTNLPWTMLRLPESSPNLPEIMENTTKEKGQQICWSTSVMPFSKKARYWTQPHSEHSFPKWGNTQARLTSG